MLFCVWRGSCAARHSFFSHCQSPPRCSSERGARPAHRYAAEYKLGLAEAMKVADAAGANVTILGTTPAHNTAQAAVDDATVVALNKATKAMAVSGLPCNIGREGG